MGISRTMAIAAGLVTAVLVLCLGGLWWQSGAEERELKQACAAAAESKLDAPATADFDLDLITGEGDQRRVTGQVDAENTHGAKVRSDVDCRLVRDGDVWMVESVSVS